MSKFIPSLTFGLLTTLLAACSADSTPAEKVTSTPHKANQQLVDAGVRDARAALEHDCGSSERVNAVLEIHAKAHELAQKGMPNCADDYLTGARSVLSEL